MQFTELTELKKREIEAQTTTNKAIEALCDRLGEFVRGFSIESASWMSVLDYVPKPEEGKKNHSIHPELGGLQLQLVMRAKPHNEAEPKKYGVVQLDFLDAGEKRFIKCTMQPRGNERMDDMFQSRLIEYLQGELNVLDAEQLH